jgi:hypothetical protein
MWLLERLPGCIAAHATCTCKIAAAAAAAVLSCTCKQMLSAAAAALSFDA